MGRLVLALGVLVLTVCVEAPTRAATQPVDYSQDQNWLCRPGRADPCSTPTRTTVIGQDGVQAQVESAARQDAPIDCFYVYPTVSREAAPNRDMAPTGVEEATATAQFARFSSECKPYAPRYRQVTVAGLRAAIAGYGPQPDEALAYQDVLAAFHSYLAHDNHGRGFVLLGHSQGSKILMRLIATEIDGKPLQAQLVSAIIPGELVEIPAHAGSGGTFANLPLCAMATDVACVIAYSSYLAAAMPVADPRFGVAKSADRVAGCVDPARLLGAAHLDTLMPSRVLPTLAATTTFIELPATIKSECVSQGAQAYLAISVADPVATVPIAVTLEAIEGRLPGWGLHVLDVNLALGSLVAIVREQARTWKAQPRSGH